MGVELQRNSYTASEQIAKKLNISISKVILVLKEYQKRVIGYIESGEKVPISGIATIKVLQKIIVYEVGGKYKHRDVTGNLDINTKLLSDEVALALNFTRKETYTIIKEYLEILVDRLVQGNPVYITGIIGLYTDEGIDNLLVRSSVSPVLRKRIQELGYKNVYSRTSEKLKTVVYERTLGKVRG